MKRTRESDSSLAGRRTLLSHPSSSRHVSHVVIKCTLRRTSPVATSFLLHEIAKDMLYVHHG